MYTVSENSESSDSECHTIESINISLLFMANELIHVFLQNVYMTSETKV
jgi:hypothetical protein